MIEINELRVGNLVQDKHGNIIPVDSIVSAEGNGINAPVSYNGCCPDYSLSDIYPIPLSEQWLLDLGAIKVNRDFYWGYDNQFQIHYVGHVLCLWVRDFLFIPIHTVHKLQNIYFVYMEDELVYKPKTT